jgi:hypothetical protein
MIQFLEYDAASLGNPFATFRNCIEKRVPIDTAPYSSRMGSHQDLLLLFHSLYLTGSLVHRDGDNASLLKFHIYAISIQLMNNI